MRRGQAARLTVAGGLGFLLTAPAGAQIPCAYEVSAIIQGPYCPPFGYPPTIPRGISEESAVVGSYSVCTVGPSVPFLWTEASGLVILVVPSGYSAGGARAIDDQTGWIAGSMTPQGLNRPTAAVWTHPDGLPVDLGTLPGGNYSQAFGAGGGRVVGKWGNDITGDPALQAFVWQDWQMIDLGPDLGTPNGEARDANAAGQIVGWMGQAPQIDARAFIWEDGQVTDLGPIPGGFTSEAWAINSALQVVGCGRLVDNETKDIVLRAWYWQDGNMINLGTLPGLSHSAAYDLNDGGLAVGTASGSGGAQEAFIWYDGVMIDLNTMIPPDAGVHIRIAHGVNNSGQIACQANMVDNLDSVGLVLTPIERAPADLDGDGTVGLLDFLMLLGAWGPCPEPCPPACTGDIDCDCTVGIVDFLNLLANWS
jgi:probable HAF family extracellular repeat protein